MEDYATLLDHDGPLAARIAGFAPRPQQQTLATAVGDILAVGGRLFAEAGTGVGKTFAYLVPALLSGRRVVISTGTKNLQDQLFHRDLPVVREALGMPVKVALLKGRANYLCTHRLQLASEQGRLDSRSAATDLRRVAQWALSTREGDIAELADVAENSSVWPLVTSTAENCLGGDCPEYGRCHVVAARKRALESEVVVVNHHLLLADMALKEGGFGELLPGVDAVIVDEAHQLPEIASNYFGESLSSGQLNDLCRDTLAEYLKTAADEPGFQRSLDRVQTASADLRLAFGLPAGRHEWRVCSTDKVHTALDELIASLDDLVEALAPLGPRARGLEQCAERARELLDRAQRFADAREPAEDADAEFEAEDIQIRWVETYRRAFVLNMTPEEVAGRLRERIDAQDCAWIFTSATLAVDGSVSHFQRRMGLDSGTVLVLDSPFDYARNAVLFLPRDLPLPNAPDHTRAVVDAARPLLQAGHGGAFMLFTSHRALDQAAGLLTDELGERLLVQGDMPRARLIERFREAGDAVLLGTASFWEGVDVKGPALSVVVIDKLPFASPGDPVMKARLAAMERRGLNSFRDFQLPQAVLALKQGVGRLIRDPADRGVMMICDPRLGNRSYGRVFLRSLPKMHITHDAGEAVHFLKHVEAGGHELAEAGA